MRKACLMSLRPNLIIPTALLTISTKRDCLVTPCLDLARGVKMMPKCFAFLIICMPRRRIGVDGLLIALWDEAVATVSPFPSEAQRSRRDTCAKAQFLEEHRPKCLAQAIVECGGDPLFSEGPP